MRLAASASETHFSAAIVLVVGGLGQRNTLRCAQSIHPSCRDVPIHLGAALVVTLDPSSEGSFLVRTPGFPPPFFVTNLNYIPPRPVDSSIPDWQGVVNSGPSDPQ
jgi:hypothetical protein